MLEMEGTAQKQECRSNKHFEETEQNKIVLS